MIEINLSFTAPDKKSVSNCTKKGDDQNSIGAQELSWGVAIV